MIPAIYCEPKQNFGWCYDNEMITWGLSKESRRVSLMSNDREGIEPLILPKNNSFLTHFQNLDK